MKQYPIISINQINTVTGDINGNYEKIIECIKKDASSGAEISIFPETAFTGYMCGALWDNANFIHEQEICIQKIKDHIEKINYNGIVIIGFIEQDGLRKNGLPRLYNAAAIIQAYRNFKIYKKRILASNDHHEDKKYFLSGSACQDSENDIVFDVNLPKFGAIRIGIPICEDMWHINHEWNLPKDMVKKYGADIIININQSYFHYGKLQQRYDLLQKFSEEYKVPVVYCNSVGVGDIVKNIVIFDGGSMVFDNGELIRQLPQFSKFNEILYKWDKIEFTPRSKYYSILDALLFEQSEFFRLNGIKKAQVHLSGGLDSAIVAVLAVLAMERENVVFITNPSDLNTKSLKFVHHLVNKLGCELEVNPIQSIYEEFIKVDQNSFGSKLGQSGQASVQAVLRTVQGLAATHRFGSGIIATGNHTEIALGWASFHDIGSIGVHALIGDMTKLELFQFAEFINDEIFKDDVIPKEIYNGKFKPSAELPDAPGEDPIDYNIYSGICALMIRERKSISQITKFWDLLSRFPSFAHNKVGEKDIFPAMKYFPDINSILKYTRNEFQAHVQRASDLMKKSVYKTAQGAPIVIINPRSRGFSNRETLLNKYND